MMIVLLQQKVSVKLSESIVTPQIELDEAPHTFEENSFNFTADSPAPSHDSSDPPDMEKSVRQNAKRQRERDEDDDEEEVLRFLKQRVKSMRVQQQQQQQQPASGSEPSSSHPGKYQHLAYHWADKLSSLRGEQRIFAEKLINDTFYEAEFGRLGHGCRIVPFSQVDTR